MIAVVVLVVHVLCRPVDYDCPCLHFEAFWVLATKHIWPTLQRSWPLLADLGSMTFGDLQWHQGHHFQDYFLCQDHGTLHMQHLQEKIPFTAASGKCMLGWHQVTAALCSIWQVLSGETNTFWQKLITWRSMKSAWWQPWLIITWSRVASSLTTWGPCRGVLISLFFKEKDHLIYVACII